jgi:hypothetical protein
MKLYRNIKLYYNKSKYIIKRNITKQFSQLDNKIKLNLNNYNKNIIKSKPAQLKHYKTNKRSYKNNFLVYYKKTNDYYNKLININ